MNLAISIIAFIAALLFLVRNFGYIASVNSIEDGIRATLYALLNISVAVVLLAVANIFFFKA